MAEPKVIRKCKALVKDDNGRASECGTILKGECPNRREHVWTLRTGFCGIGACEGAHIIGAGGKPLKTCEEWKYCPCECHRMYDQMFQMSEMSRVLVDNSGYSPEHSQFWMPSLEDRVALLASSRAVGPIAPVMLESPLPEAIPATLRRTFAPTPTGRSARGELESWVKDVCDEYLVENYRAPCTPAFVSEAIAKAQGLAPRSVGAIDAVFKRWEELGFALIGRKPTRFVAYSPDGVHLGLDAMKLRAKQTERTKMSAARRGVRA